MSRDIIQYIKEFSKLKTDVTHGFVKRYIGDGFYLIRKPGCDKVFKAKSGQGNRSYAPGSSVNLISVQGSSQRVIATLPPGGRSGLSAFPLRQGAVGSLDGVAITQAIPATVPAGSTGYAVQLIGSGFIADPVDLVSAVRLNLSSRELEDDPFVTVSSVVYVSATELDITLDVLITTPVGYLPEFSLQRG